MKKLILFLLVLLAGTAEACAQSGQYPANQVLAGPTSGSPALPKPRALVTTDIPAITSSNSTSGITSGNLIGSSSNHIVDTGIAYSGLPTVDASHNVLVGGAGPMGVGANDSVGVGVGVFAASPTGQANTALGYEACNALTSGSENVCIGEFAGLHFTATGNSNIAVGVGAMEGNNGAITGYENTAIGNSALAGITTGIGNLVLGYDGASGAGSNYSSSEQGNVVLNCTGTAGESNKVRICNGYTNTLLLDYGVNSQGWTVTGAPFGLKGNFSAADWGTAGVRYANVASTITDSSSSGTVTTAYTDVFGGNTIAANSATTFTNYYGAYIKAPVAGTNVTLTNGWALGADSAKINGNLTVTGTCSGCADTTAFSSFSPTMGCGGGSASWGTPTANYKQIGKIVHFGIQVTMSSLNTCSTGITFTLPATANSGQHWYFGGAIVAGSSYALYCDIGLISTTTAECFKYDGTVPGGTSNVFVISGWYESN